MTASGRDLLRRLGSGETIDTLRGSLGMTRAEFDAWWAREIASRVPSPHGIRRASVLGTVRIERNAWGIPSIHAANDEDLFVGFGYALAQDRLFQLDYLRRRGSGRLAEVLGGEGSELDLITRTVGIRSVLELDLLARTVGLRRIAEQGWAKLPEETQRLLQAFSSGVNAHIEECRDRLPIEFDLLDYQPEPWTPLDCLTIEVEFGWYLTGRFPVIVIPELIRRTLGDGPLYRATLTAEADEESILYPGTYSPSTAPASGGHAVGHPQSAEGSNNWVLSGRHTASGKPLVASDPHVPFDANSWWWEVHLCGGSFHVAGMSYVGIPAVMFGRNERVAWGCTNNICSQRDLYQEKTDPSHPGCFFYDGHWERWQEREEEIRVKGRPPVCRTIRVSRNGPIVDEVLPPQARATGPVSLRWLGNEHGDWLSALLAMDRAKTAETFRQAAQGGLVPTFNVVYADADGHVGMQTTGRIPLRKLAERGYRPGWDPAHTWHGVIPPEAMPHVADPDRGWLATANNRLAPEDYPYPLSGTWTDGLRARRIRQMIEEGLTAPATRAHSVAMHQDALSLRAQTCLPPLLAVLSESPDERFQETARHLAAWDCRMEPDRVGATLFDVFFAHWTRIVARERFEGEDAGLIAGGLNSLATQLLKSDDLGWFRTRSRDEAIRAAMLAALAWLTECLGAEIGSWSWGRIHTLPLRHILSGRGDLGQLLDHGGIPVKGDMTTVCNTGLGSRCEARSGANYRLLADLGEQPPTLWAVDASSQSGHPGSPHYSDQLRPWAKGEYHALPLDRTAAEKLAYSRITLEPYLV